MEIFRHPRLDDVACTIAHSLAGPWRSETIFELGQVVDSYDFYYKQIAVCDLELQARITAVPNGRAAADEGAEQSAGASKRRCKTKNHPSLICVWN